MLRGSKSILMVGVVEISAWETAHPAAATTVTSGGREEEEKLEAEVDRMMMTVGSR